MSRKPKKVSSAGFYINPNPRFDSDGAEIDDDIHPSGEAAVQSAARINPLLASALNQVDANTEVDDEPVASKPKTKPKKTVPVEAKNTEAPTHNEYTSMGILEKVALMNSLREVLIDDQVKKTVLGKANGDRVYQIFTKAVEKELENMFGLDQDESLASSFDAMVNTLQRSTQVLDEAARKQADLLTKMSNADVARVLEIIANKLTNS